jgi:hypothetical protein
VPVECGHLLALQGGVSAHAGDRFVRVTVGGPELRRTHLTALLRLGGWVVGGAASKQLSASYVDHVSLLVAPLKTCPQEPPQLTVLFSVFSCGARDSVSTLLA